MVYKILKNIFIYGLVKQVLGVSRIQKRVDVSKESRVTSTVEYKGAP